jgi:glycosyltransferase involved in cell wall biosynthesis
VEEKEPQPETQKQPALGYKRYNSRRKRYHHKSNQSSQTERVRSSFKKISIIIPLFNEEESIVPLSHELRKALSRININYEVILIDDGSTDSSLQKLKEITKTDNRFRYLSFRKNYGKSAALHIGFKAASGDAVVTMDADLQDDPGEIHSLLKKLEEGFDLCSGWKKKRQDPFIKKISSKFFNFVTRVISGIKIHDFNCGLKAYKKEVVENVNVMVSFIDTFLCSRNGKVIL